MSVLYPILLDLTGKRCLVVGGGQVAERKVGRLLECGAAVEVVAPAATPGLEALADDGRIRLWRRPARPEDVADAFLVFAATDDPAVNRALAGSARARGTLVNVADDPDACTFLVPAVFRRGDLTVAVSSGGGSPALAKRLRERLEATIGPEYEAFLAALRQLREEAQARISDPAVRQTLYRQALDSDLFATAAGGDREAVTAQIAALLDAIQDRQASR
jgi:precorrin-2 dehydrogenase / sirohydrochlorin ferrochelatase